MNSFYNLKKLFKEDLVMFRKVNNSRQSLFIAVNKLDQKEDICTVHSPDNFKYLNSNSNPYLSLISGESRFQKIDFFNIDEKYKLIFDTFEHQIVEFYKKLHSCDLGLNNYKNNILKNDKSILLDNNSDLVNQISLNLRKKVRYLPYIYVAFSEYYKSIQSFTFDFEKYIDVKRNNVQIEKVEINVDTDNILINDKKFSYDGVLNYILEYEKFANSKIKDIL